MTAKDLLFKEEMTGLRSIYYFRILFGVILVFMILPVGQSIMEKVTISIISPLIILYCIISIFFFINKERGIRLIGVIGSLINIRMARFTDRNCHFGIFAVFGRNSAFAPNYNCFRTPDN